MLGKSVPRSLSPFFEDPMNLSIRFLFLSSFPFVYGKESLMGFSQHTYPGVHLFSKQGSERANPRSNF